MPDPKDLLALAERVERATDLAHQSRLIEEAWDVLAEQSASFRRFACAYSSGFDTNAGRFSAMLEASAYESAAMMLLPESDADTAVFWRLGNDGEGGDPSLFKAEVLTVSAFTSTSYTAVAETPALALLSAILKAAAQSGGEG
jgi:hypothetical protein